MINDFIQKTYAPFLMRPLVRALVLIWLAIYLGFAAWGCSRIREGLEPVHLLVEGSYAIPHYRALQHYFWHYGSEVQIVVNNPGDLSDPVQREKASEMARDFANTKYTIGVEGTQFWLDDFLVYANQSGIPEERLRAEFVTLASRFVNSKEFLHWREDVRFDDSTSRILAYRFTAGMKNFQDTNNQRRTTELMRAVAARFPERNVTTFMPLWLFTDQYMVVLSNTLQDIAIALVSVLAITVVLIPHPLCSIWIALTIVSIDAGVMGYMTLWGVNLDVISMITLNMSIGFSVDFSAHITYGYVVSRALTSKERVQDALTGMGWPNLQGALSMILGVATLANVNSYVLVTFFRCMVLVIVLGMIHGMVFLPVLLSIFVHNCGGCKRRSVEEDNNNNEAIGKHPSQNPLVMVPVGIAFPAAVSKAAESEPGAVTSTPTSKSRGPDAIFLVNDD